MLIPAPLAKPISRSEMTPTAASTFSPGRRLAIMESTVPYRLCSSMEINTGTAKTISDLNIGPSACPDWKNSGTAPAAAPAPVCSSARSLPASSWPFLKALPMCLLRFAQQHIIITYHNHAGKSYHYCDTTREGLACSRQTTRSICTRAGRSVRQRNRQTPIAPIPSAPSAMPAPSPGTGIRKENAFACRRERWFTPAGNAFWPRATSALSTPTFCTCSATAPGRPARFRTTSFCRSCCAKTTG